MDLRERTSWGRRAAEGLLRFRLPLLLAIFNPEGWLDTTFVGGGLRVGRDDKGHVFVLERQAEGGGQAA